MVTVQYYNTHARQQHPKCPVSRGEGINKWDKFLEDEIRLLRRDRINYERERSQILQLSIHSYGSFS